MYLDSVGKVRKYLVVEVDVVVEVELVVGLLLVGFGTRRRL